MSFKDFLDRNNPIGYGINRHKKLRALTALGNKNLTGAYNDYTDALTARNVAKATTAWIPLLGAGVGAVLGAVVAPELLKDASEALKEKSNFLGGTFGGAAVAGLMSLIPDNTKDVAADVKNAQADFKRAVNDYLFANQNDLDTENKIVENALKAGQSVRPSLALLNALADGKQR